MELDARIAGGECATQISPERLTTGRASGIVADPATLFCEVKNDDIATAFINYGLTLLMLPAMLPLIVSCWLMIKLSAPRESAIFKQTRYGKGGRPFVIYKFRTMVPNAEALKSALIELSVDKGPGFKIVNDPRVTPIGKFLRKSHLDELPQLFNVLKGEMSLVGPRANSYSPDHYEPWQLRRLSVKPGVTGTWQIARIKPEGFVERCKMDIAYIENKSALGDLAILFKTVFVCLIRRPGH